MKKRNTKKSSPEEAFLRSAEERMDIELNYGLIQDQLDTAEIVRVGAARQAAKTDTFTLRPTAVKASRGPSVTVVLASVLAVITAVGFGGFLIAKQAGKTTPPTSDPHGRPPLTDSVGDSVTDRGTLPEPNQGILPEESSSGVSPNGTTDRTSGLESTQPEEPSDEPTPGETHNNLDPGFEMTEPEDTLSEETLPHLPPLSSVDPDGLDRLSDAVFDLNSSYATENILSDPSSSHATQYTLFLRMDHLPTESLPAESLGGERPSMLWVEDYELWEGLFPNLSARTYEDYSVLDVSLYGYDSWFFQNHSLLILFTGGRSGSVRYRVDDPVANNTYVRATLTAGVPYANTMDVAHWCVIIPVDKPKNGETNRLVFLETQDVPMDSFEEFVTLPLEVYRGLWFWSSSSGSYERDGYLYGRISQNTEKQSWDFPCAETVTSFEEWQAIYGGYTHDDPSVYPLHQGFQEGVNAIDEAFFEQKSLAVVYVRWWSASHYRVDEVDVRNGSLAVKITILSPPAGDDDIGCWAILIPIDKELDSLPATVEQEEVFPSWEEWETLPENQYWEEWYGE